jgi:hypothetical protein
MKSEFIIHIPQEGGTYEQRLYKDYVPSHIAIGEMFRIHDNSADINPKCFINYIISRIDHDFDDRDQAYHNPTHKISIYLTKISPWNERP